jgi:hypothetical protein
MTIQPCQTYQEFFGESPQLFELCQACDFSKKAAELALSRLSAGCRNEVLERIPQCGPLEDLLRLRAASNEVARQIFDSLTPSQRLWAQGCVDACADCPDALPRALAYAVIQERMHDWEGCLPPPDVASAVFERVYRFVDNPNASSLNLSFLNLHCLPRIFDIPPFTKRLTYLNCSHNQLTELPTISGALRSLDCCCNKLKALPAGIENLTALKGLQCGYNQLTVVPEEIGALSSLRTLNFFRNPLTTLPMALLRLPQECQIFLYDCPLSTEVCNALLAAAKEADYRGPKIIFELLNDIPAQAQGGSWN